MTAAPAADYFTYPDEASLIGPMNRFEWERIIRRVKMPATSKLLALTLATYADKDGTRIHPGTERLARVMCVSVPTVKRSLEWLRSRGFVERVKHGNRHARQADQYQLTTPSTLLEMELLTPEECGGLGITGDT